MRFFLLSCHIKERDDTFPNNYGTTFTNTPKFKLAVTYAITTKFQWTANEQLLNHRKPFPFSLLILYPYPSDRDWHCDCDGSIEKAALIFEKKKWYKIFNKYERN